MTRNLDLDIDLASMICKTLYVSASGSIYSSESGDKWSLT